MAGKGGATPGAGRKKGIPNKATQQRQADISASGITPLEVMIEAMRYHYDLAQAEKAKGEAGDPDLLCADMREARAAAKDAAPYVHPALKSVEVGGIGGGPVEILHLLDLVSSERRTIPSDDSAD